MLPKKYFLVFVVTIIFFSCSEKNNATAAAEAVKLATQKDSIANVDYQEGKTLFVANCNACHALTKHANPLLLIGLDQRWKDKKILYDFIRNPQEVIKKDTYAKAMYEQYNHVEMTAIPWMTDKQIGLILDYIDKELPSKQ